MKRFGKAFASIVAIMLFCVLVLFFPYSIKGVPEWRLKIVDQNGQPAVGAQVAQEWIDPDREGEGNPMDIKVSGPDGLVVFPAHRVHDRLSNLKRLTASTHAYTCWNGQYGDISWYGGTQLLPTVLRLKAGSVCPCG
jgi:hypothetical protein